jgi:hypothetical protein
MPKRFLLFISSLLLWVETANAQIELSSFSATSRAGVSTALATDYQAQGINPANLGLTPQYDAFHNTIGLGELGFSVYSDALSRVNMNQALFNPNKKFTRTEKAEAARDFANKGLTFNLDFLYAGYAFQKSEGGSGFCFTMRERAQWYSKFSPLASEILFQGFNAQLSANGALRPYFDSLLTNVSYDSVNNKLVIDTVGAIATLPKTLSEILDGTRISMSWNREYAFSYGVNIVNNFDFKLLVGVGVKYIQGIGYMDIESDGKNLTAFISASPWFGIKFGRNGRLAPGTDSVNVGFLPNSAGQGLGFEFGATAILKDKFRISASLTDLGSVNYKTNVYSASDTFLTSLTTRGFTNFDFFRNAQQFDGFQKDLVQWKGLRNRVQYLPTKLRFGFAYLHEKVQAGLDVVIPLNKVAGNFNKPVLSIGGEYRVTEWLHLGSGMMVGGNYSNALIPFGITFVTSNGLWEMGVSTRDVTTYMKSRNPMLSLTTGLLRFRF